MKGKSINAARTHRQKASDTGGTNPAAPRATAIFPVINIGWINKNNKGKKLTFWSFKIFTMVV